VFDDGIGGERVTPTGAAILRHLAPLTGGPTIAMEIGRCGMGFGSKELPDLPNMLRIIEFKHSLEATFDQVTVLAFEIDDQTPEDLAIGLESLRRTDGVLDVSVCAVTAKKGRQANSIQVLTVPGAEHEIIKVCYAQTTTLGVRYHRMNRSSLKRKEVKVNKIGVKIAKRPEGDTAKAEIDDLARNNSTHATRADAGHEIAAAVISKEAEKSE
jgi:uncharacterized protein (DUF111 family)